MTPSTQFPLQLALAPRVGWTTDALDMGGISVWCSIHKSPQQHVDVELRLAPRRISALSSSTLHPTNVPNVGGESVATATTTVSASHDIFTTTAQVCLGWGTSDERTFDLAAVVDDADVLQKVSKHHCDIQLDYRRENDTALDSDRWTAARLGQHSCLVLEKLIVCDNNSLYGTWCNGVRLLPFHPYTVVPPRNDCSALTLCLAGCVTLRFPLTSAARRNRTESLPRGALVDAGFQTDQLPANEEHPQPVPPAKPKRGQGKKVVIVHDDSPDPPLPPIRSRRKNAPQEPLTGKPSSRPAQMAASTTAATAVSCTSAPPQPTSVCCGVEDASPALVIVTTGTRLSADERARCEALRLAVNPPIERFSEARLLVVEPPLMRSVKLLTAVPFVECIVHRSWLNAVLATGRVDVSIARHRYSEPYTRRGIEATNGFRIDSLMATTTPRSRQQLLLAKKVFVHPEAAPQESPGNNLCSVVTASGGTLCYDASEADVVILPNAVPAPVLQKIQGRRGSSAGSTALLLTVDDLFRGVLQQNLTSSLCVKVERDVDVGGEATPSSARSTRGSQRSRKRGRSAT